MGWGVVGYPIAGALLDYALALPFAVALALYNQLFRRPSFHFAAVFAAAPLLTTLFFAEIGLGQAIVAAAAISLAGALILDRAIGWSGAASVSGSARPFFVSTTIYLAAIQVLLIFFGAAPRSLTLGVSDQFSWMGLTISGAVLVVHLICLGAGLAAALFYDAHWGARLRLSAGGSLDAALVGLKLKRLHLVAAMAVTALVIIAAIARGLVLPFSVYSGFPIFVLCFCASALPAGTSLLSTAILLLLIYLVRAFAAFYLSAQVADAVTLGFALTMLTVLLSATSLRARGA